MPFAPVFHGDAPGRPAVSYCKRLPRSGATEEWCVEDGRSDFVALSGDATRAMLGQMGNHASRFADGLRTVEINSHVVRPIERQP
jgi:hypothetical protein